MIASFVPTKLSPPLTATTSPALPCDVIIVTAVKSLPSPFRLAMEQQALIMSFLNSYQFRYSTVLPCRSQIASPGGTRASRRAASSSTSEEHTSELHSLLA